MHRSATVVLVEMRLIGYMLLRSNTPALTCSSVESTLSERPAPVSVQSSGVRCCHCMQAIKCHMALCQGGAEVPVVEAESQLHLAELLLDHTHDVYEARQHLERAVCCSISVSWLAYHVNTTANFNRTQLETLVQGKQQAGFPQTCYMQNLLMFLKGHSSSFLSLSPWSMHLCSE